MREISCQSHSFLIKLDVFKKKPFKLSFGCETKKLSILNVKENSREYFGSQWTSWNITAFVLHSSLENYPWKKFDNKSAANPFNHDCQFKFLLHSVPLFLFHIFV